MEQDPRSDSSDPDRAQDEERSTAGSADTAGTGGRTRDRLPRAWLMAIAGAAALLLVLVLVLAVQRAAARRGSDVSDSLSGARRATGAATEVSDLATGTRSTTGSADATTGAAGSGAASKKTGDGKSTGASKAGGGGSGGGGNPGSTSGGSGANGDTPVDPAPDDAPLEPVSQPPEGTLAMVERSSASEGDTYEVTFRPYGEGPPQPPTIVIRIETSKPSAATKKPLALAGRNALVLVTTAGGKVVTSGGLYAGTLKMVPHSGLLAPRLEEARRLD